MSIENAYRPDVTRKNPEPRKEPKNSKSKLRRIIAGVVGLGAAGYMALPNADSAQSQVTRDKITNTKPDTNKEPHFDPSRFVTYSPDVSTTEPEPDTSEPLELKRPKPDDSVSLDSDQEISFPPELQDQVNELHKLCDDFYHEDPWTLLDPLRPPITQQIYRHYTELADEAEKYPNVPYFNVESFCGNREKFYKRFKNLADTVLGSDLPDATKERLLFDLGRPESNFYNGGFDSTYEMSEFFGNLPKDEEKNPELYQKYLKDKHDLTMSYLDYGLKEGGNLSLEEYEHLAYRLYYAKTYEKSLFTPEELESITKFITPHLRDNAYLNQSGHYKEWNEAMNKPPGSHPSEEDIQNWQSSINYHLSKLIEAIEEGKEQDFNIEPGDYGCAYSLEELKAMQAELDPDSE